MSDILSKVMGACPVVLNLSVADKKVLVERLVDALIAAGQLASGHRDAIIQAVMRREAVSSTVLPGGIGFPHTRTELLDQPCAAVGISAKGLLLDAPDDQPTHIIVLLLSPAANGCQHIRFMASLSRRLMDQKVLRKLIGAKDAKTVRKLLIG